MTSLFETLASSNFMPHGYCLQWEPGLLWLHLGSDLAIAAAYFSIPLVLLNVARSERWAPYSKVLLLFGAFILACGATHLMSIWTLWHAHYYAEGVLKAATAGISVTAAVALARFAPLIPALKTPVEVEAAFARIELEKLERQRAESALAEGDALLRSLMEHVPASIFVKDLDGRFLMANQCFASFCGVSHPNDIVGKRCSDFRDESEAAESDRIDQEILRSGQPYVNPEERRRLLSRPGEEFWAHATKALWLDPKGEALGVVGVSIDITQQKKTQLELARLASIVQTANVAIIGADLDGMITSWNRGAELLFDQSAGEMIGRNFSELEAPNAKGDFACNLARVRQGERVETAEVLRVRWGGEILQVAETVSAVIGPAGDVVGVSIIAADVTEKVAAERALRMIQTHLSVILENTAAGIFVKTLDGRYVMSNPVHAAMCGLDVEDVIGKTDHDLEPGHVAEARCACDLRAVGSRSPVHYEETVKLDGEPHSYHVIKMPLWDGDGRIYGVCGIASDITEQKQAEESRRLNERLVEANRELAERHREAERLRTMQNEFLAGMSHELRTPLNAIIGFSDLLHKQIGGPLTEKQSGFVQRVRDGGGHLLRLINNVLDAAKMEAGHLEVAQEPIELTPLITEVSAFMEPLATQRDLALSTHCETPLTALGDPLRVRQILFNLLSNAIKFAREGGSVSLEARASGDVIEIAVADDGAGIDEADQSVIFDRFRQAKASSKNGSEGAGLGLFISKMLAERMSGAIKVESRKGEGACFTFSLPFAAPQRSQAASAGPTRLERGD
ncbi:MAG: PAS domain-containing sensor histidine kinase [Acidobacteria bacterium]|nr:PAS domain-containing sensor histidine kinase [Acidobacteriota bacterium]